MKSRVNGSIFNEVTELRMLIEGPKQNAVGNQKNPEWEVPLVSYPSSWSTDKAIFVKLPLS